MTDPALESLLSRKDVLEGVISRIDVWLLIFGIFVVIGVAGESVFGIRAWWNNRKLHTVLESIESLRNLETAKANERSAQADQKAAEAKLELEKLRTPRTISHIPELLTTLEAFKGTEYTFSAVCADEESINLLKEIGALLQRAGWKRGKPVGGFPAINVFGKEVDFSVPVSLLTGVSISIDSPNGSLQSLTIATMPQYARAAVALNLSLSFNLSPPQESSGKVNTELGDSTVVRINVGKKR